MSQDDAVVYDFLERPTYDLYVAHSANTWNIAVINGDEQHRYVGESHTSVTATPLQGVTQVLARLPENSIVTVYSNSEYLIKGASEWIYSWIAGGWLKSSYYDGGPVANQDLWLGLITTSGQRMGWVTWERRDWVRSRFAHLRPEHLPTLPILLDDAERYAQILLDVRKEQEYWRTPGALDSLAEEWGYDNWEAYANVTD